MTIRARWHKSSFSGQNSDCVEVCFGQATVSIRDSKYLRNPANRTEDQPILTVTADGWRVFIDELLGKSASTSAITVRTDVGGCVTLSAHTSSVALTYTPTEWAAFLSGVRAGELISAAAA